MDSQYSFGNVDYIISLPDCPSAPSSCRVDGAQVPALHPSTPSIPLPPYPHPLTWPRELPLKWEIFISWWCSPHGHARSIFQNCLPPNCLQIHTFIAHLSYLLGSTLLRMFNSNFPAIPHGFKMYEEDGFLWGSFWRDFSCMMLGFKALLEGSALTQWEPPFSSGTVGKGK